MFPGNPQGTGNLIPQSQSVGQLAPGGQMPQLQQISQISQMQVQQMQMGQVQQQINPMTQMHMGQMPQGMGMGQMPQGMGSLPQSPQGIQPQMMAQNRNPYMQTPQREEEPEPEQSEAVSQRYSSMTDEERKRFDVLKASENIPDKTQVEDIMRNAGGRDVTKDSLDLICKATKLFLIELIEIAKRYNHTDGPLTPDHIMLAMQQYDDENKLPGRGPGVRRTCVRN